MPEPRQPNCPYCLDIGSIEWKGRRIPCDVNNPAPEPVVPEPSETRAQRRYRASLEV